MAGYQRQFLFCAFSEQPARMTVPQYRKVSDANRSRLLAEAVGKVDEYGI